MTGDRSDPTPYEPASAGNTVPEGDSTTLEQLAAGSGVPIDQARRLVDAGLLREGPDGFRAPDLTKMRLVRALLEAGFDVEQLQQAVSEGSLSLDFVDLLLPEPIPLVEVPDGEPGIDDEGAREMIRTLLGSDVEEGMIRRDDLELLRLAARGRALGASMEHIVRSVRATALAAQHIVDLQREFVDEVLLAPALRETGSPTAALAATAAVRYEYRGLGMRLVALLLERFANDAVFGNVVAMTEMSLLRGGLGPQEDDQAVVFVDVSDYTRLSREVGDAVAAEQALLLTDVALERAKVHGGRLVRSLGDAALVHFPRADAAVAFAVDMVANADDRGLWRLHAGVNAGSMLRRDGEYYGTAVNIASRVADAAGPGQVVVTRKVRDAWHGDSVTFEPLGHIPVKNVEEPVEMFLAVAASSEVVTGGEAEGGLVERAKP